MVKAERQEQKVFYRMSGTILQAITHRSCGDGMVRTEVIDSIDITTTDWSWDDVKDVFNPSF